MRTNPPSVSMGVWQDGMGTMPLYTPPSAPTLGTIVLTDIALPGTMNFVAGGANLAAYSTKTIAAAKTSKVQGSPVFTFTNLGANLGVGSAAYPGAGISDGTDTYTAGYKGGGSVQGNGEQFDLAALPDVGPYWLYFPGTTFGGKLKCIITLTEANLQSTQQTLIVPAASTSTTLHRLFKAVITPAAAGATVQAKLTQETLDGSSYFDGSFYGILLRSAV